MPELQDNTYTSLEEALRAAHSSALASGFALVTKRSVKSKRTLEVSTVDLKCDRGGLPRARAQQGQIRNTSTRLTGCLYTVKLRLANHGGAEGLLVTVTLVSLIRSSQRSQC